MCQINHSFNNLWNFRFKYYITSWCFKFNYFFLFSLWNFSFLYKNNTHLYTFFTYPFFLFFFNYFFFLNLIFPQISLFIFLIHKTFILKKIKNILIKITKQRFQKHTSCHNEKNNFLLTFYFFLINFLL